MTCTEKCNLLMIDFLTAAPQFDLFSSIFSYMYFHLFPPYRLKRLWDSHFLYRIFAIFPSNVKSTSALINLILLKIIPSLLVTNSFSSMIFLTVPVWAKLLKYWCSSLVDFAFSVSVLLREDTSSPIASAWIADTERFVVGLLFSVSIVGGDCTVCWFFEWI